LDDEIDAHAMKAASAGPEFSLALTLRTPTSSFSTPTLCLNGLRQRQLCWKWCEKPSL
jgi:hypothetical protein